jgi:hypothetical protein
MIFQMMAFSVIAYICFTCRILVKTLESKLDANVEIPLVEKITECQTLMKEQLSRFADVWCCMNGLKLYRQAVGNSMKP